MFPIDPPLLSDHALIIADCICRSSPVISQRYYQTRHWRGLDVDAFTADLVGSGLVVAPSDDVSKAFDHYNTILRDLLDKHAPLILKRVSTRSSARWYDSECGDTKRVTRRLEKKYRRLHTDESLVARRRQVEQRLLFQSKYTSFWSSMIDSFDRNRSELYAAATKTTFIKAFSRRFRYILPR